MPEAGTYSYLKRLAVGRQIPTHLIGPAAIVLLRLAAAIGTPAVVGALAALLWQAPWPVDALAAVGAAAAWTSWLDDQEQA